MLRATRPSRVCGLLEPGNSADDPTASLPLTPALGLALDLSQILSFPLSLYGWLGYVLESSLGVLSIQSSGRGAKKRCKDISAES